jgi:nucleotide-binding universal stress UspA family protein
LFKNILLATDFSTNALAARDAAVTLSGHEDMKLTVLHVYDLHQKLMDEGVFVHSELVEKAEQKRFQIEADEKLADYCKPLKDLFNKCDTLVREGNARQTIIRTADEIGADLIVIGSHSKKGFIDTSLGGVARYVGEHAHCPVLIMTDYKHQKERKALYKGDIMERETETISEVPKDCCCCSSAKSEMEYRVDKTPAEKQLTGEDEFSKEI